MTSQISSTSSEETELLGASIGVKLRGGEVIELKSDLGGGKTTFTRGLVRGSGSSDRVASPTFTLSREYAAPRFRILHFDFYRLAEAGIMHEEFAECIGNPNYVVVVEWGDVMSNVLPEHRLSITIARTAEDEGARELTITAPKSLSYLLDGTGAEVSA